ncbi:sigma-70 family RNA polymerase sigma factor [uncultured Paludibaculum sp.]|uniref:RNA polymerase sigma factor n=1 Tax=uncultured Paludibaculum sp. TaxID=1765020 RepID=UPI002AAB975A|nr:sigma-70 family RNA polymerase sigma factor [uncultured Paludibaculum sp.]
MLSPSSSLNEASLLARLHAGEDLAFELLYERYQPRIYRYVLRMSSSRELADDIVQEVFLGLIRGARGYDAASGPLGSYLYGMARNLLFRHLGAKPMEELDEGSMVSEHDPLDGLARSEQIERVRQALAAMPAHYREAVVLCDMEEMSYSAVAELLGVAVGTIRSRLHRARGLLLERLSQERCGA